MKKFWKNEDMTDDGPHFCKKCGCELVSTNRKKLCANCQKEKVDTFKSWGLGGLGAIGLVMFGVISNSNGSDDQVANSEEDEDEYI